MNFDTIYQCVNVVFDFIFEIKDIYPRYIFFFVVIAVKLLSHFSFSFFAWKSNAVWQMGPSHKISKYKCVLLHTIACHEFRITLPDIKENSCKQNTTAMSNLMHTC